MDKVDGMYSMDTNCVGTKSQVYPLIRYLASNLLKFQHMLVAVWVAGNLLVALPIRTPVAENQNLRHSREAAPKCHSVIKEPLRTKNQVRFLYPLTSQGNQTIRLSFRDARSALIL